MFTESGIFLHVCHIDAVTPTGTRNLHDVWFNGRDFPIQVSMTQADLDQLYAIMYED